MTRTSAAVPAPRTDADAPDAPRPDPDQVRAAAAQRRKERKAARANAPAPERDEVFDELGLDDLRRMRAGLAEEETRVSYWRRIIQARLDVLRAGSATGDRVADLGRVLSDAPTLHRRLAHISVGPVDDVPPLPDLASLWARQVDDDDPASRETLADELAAAERRLSAVRAGLFRRIDGVTHELIARYREDPTLALTALPREPVSLRV